ncbi:tyrosyl-tRNA synthetase, partial [Chytridiales sp. JEL 0842]
VGGATGSIGDPSGRSTERNALSEAEVNANTAAIKAQLESIFKNAKAYYQKRLNEGGNAIPTDEVQDVQVLDNLKWFKEM